MLEGGVLSLAQLDELFLSSDLFLTLFLALSGLNPLLLDLELHLDAQLGLTLFSLLLSVGVVLLGLDLGLQTGHLFLHLALHFLPLALLLGLLSLHLNPEGFHLRRCLSLSFGLLASFSPLLCLVFYAALLLHSEFVCDGVGRIVPHGHLAVSVLAPVQQDCASAKNNTVVWLQLHGISGRELLSVDVSVLGGFETDRHEVGAVTIRHEVCMVLLDADSAESDLWHGVRVRSLAAHLRIRVL
mmetsp:Transcript_6457/g.7536  ORF Transcript_6457/g.7536 Transcript_6457/m.7536 type:complete len:242 (+) Transcript_6457:1433-2158(+)